MTDPARARIAIIDDERAMRFALTRALRKEFDLVEAEDGPTGLNLLARERPDLVLLDLNMPGMPGMEVLAKIREQESPPPVIILTAHGSESIAVDAMKKGAYDYLPKPYDIDELRIACRRALETAALKAENARLKTALGLHTGRGALIGQCEPMQRIGQLIARVAPLDATVLVHGESGTGKEVVARALHLRSPRRDGPFVALNCAALPESLMESELFGHERGAFTGAIGTRRGRFEAAEGGTLFLDEIGEAPPSLQAKLLRVLETREFERVGSTEVMTANVRLIAATNRNLKERVASGDFREDLYYRLKVVDLLLPPLRARGGDVAILAKHFVEVAALKHGLPLRALSQAAMEALSRYSFPGNVRELCNLMEKAVILSFGPMIQLADLPPEVIEEAGEVEADDAAPADAAPADAVPIGERGAAPSALPAPAATPPGGPLGDRAPGAAALASDVREATEQLDEILAQAGLSFADAKKKAIDRFETRLLTRELARHRGNVSKTARTLGLHRQSLQAKLKDLGIDAASYRA